MHRAAWPRIEGVSTAPKQTKGERQAAARAAALAENQRREAAARRGRILAIALSIGGVLAVVALVTVLLVTSLRPAATIEGLETWDDLEQTHVPGDVDYPMSPPAGGPHFAGWLNCGVYSEPQVDEQVVHSLEHGAIWVTYAPDVPGGDLQRLAERLPAEYVVLSPYPGLDSPFAVSAWGAQLKFSDPRDPRFDDFVKEYWRSSDAPEPGAPCTGAIDGPGRR